MHLTPKVKLSYYIVSLHVTFTLGCFSVHRTYLVRRCDTHTHTHTHTHMNMLMSHEKIARNKQPNRQTHTETSTIIPNHQTHWNINHSSVVYRRTRWQNTSLSREQWESCKQQTNDNKTESISNSSVVLKKTKMRKTCTYHVNNEKEANSKPTTESISHSFVV